MFNILNVYSKKQKTGIFLEKANKNMYFLKNMSTYDEEFRKL